MEFRRATSEEQALAWLAERGESARVIAGGTDVMMQYARGELTPAEFIHIEGIRSMVAVENGATTRVGALATHRYLATDPQVRRWHPALSEAAATVGGWQTQAVGTLGGNICNASPAADTVAPLLVANTIVELRSTRGTRRVSLPDFFLGRRSVDRRPEELVTAVEIEPVSESDEEIYLKTGRRGAMTVAVVGLAVRLMFDNDGKVRDSRVALCSVAPVPFRARETEQILAAGQASSPAIREAGEALTREASPIDDSRATGKYRRMILSGLLDRAVSACIARFTAKQEDD